MWLSCHVSGGAGLCTTHDLKGISELGVVVHAFNPNLGRLRQEDCH